MFRLLASDLDGTLVGDDGALSPRTQAMLDACDAAGVPVVFVTGRPPRWLDAVAGGRRGVAVCANGALVLDLASRDVVRAHPLSSDTLRSATARLREALPGVFFALETVHGFRMEVGYPWGHELDPERAGELEALLDDEPVVIKLLARVPGTHSDDLLAAARPALAGLAAPTHSNAAGGMLEIAALGVSKAAALAEVAADLGVDQADVVAFGDMPNDVEMLRWAGTSYAMGGAHPEAIAAADQLAPPCEQDGVAQVVERLLAEGQRG